MSLVPVAALVAMLASSELSSRAAPSSPHADDVVDVGHAPDPERDDAARAETAGSAGAQDDADTRRAPAPDPDEDVVRNLDVLQDLELLEHLDLLDPGGE